MLLPLAAALLIPLSRTQGAAVRLFRGAPVPSVDGLWRYDDVAEAILDSKDADIPQPLEYGSAVGPTRSLAVRFGSLDEVIPAGARITGATLVLASAEGQPLRVRSVRRLLKPWRGAGPTALVRRMRPGTKPGDEKETKRASASYRFPGRDLPGWKPLSDDSAAIEGASLSGDANGTRVSGLAATMQEMADRPWSNEGFVLQFDAEGLLGSSLSPIGRPALEVEYTLDSAKSGPDLTVLGFSPTSAGLSVTVRNLGTVAAGGKLRGVTANRSAESPIPTIAPGADATVEVAVSPPAKGRLVLEARAENDANPRNDALVSDLGGPAVGAGTPEDAERVNRMVRVWNAEAGASRFSFAVDGTEFRLTYRGYVPNSARLPEGLAGFRDLSRIAGLGDDAALNLDAATMPRVAGAPARGARDRFAGLSGAGDARTDVALPPTINPPTGPWDDPLTRRLALESLGGLSLTDVARLEAGATPPAKPRAGIVRILNPSGRPLTGLVLDLYAGDGKSFPKTPTATVTTGETGITLLPASVLSAPIIAVAATSNGEREVGFLKNWQLVAAAARGNLSAPLLDVRLNLPTLPVVRDSALSTGKFVTDSVGSTAAALGALLDDDPKTVFAATYPENGYIEIDLGRDRTLAELQLLADAMPDAFDVRLRMTGEEPAASGLWTSELDWGWTRANRPDEVLGESGVRYRGTAQRGRFLRIVFPKGGAVTIRALRALAGRVSGS